LNETRDGRGYYRDVRTLIGANLDDDYKPSRASDFDFPCALFECSEQNRICKKHQRVLYVKRVKKTPDREIDYSDKTNYTIPYGDCESWAWYKHAITEATGIPVRDQRLIHAGKMIKDDHDRAQSMKPGSTIHVIDLRK